MSALNGLLSPEGIIFVGHSETFVFQNAGFVSAQMPMAFAMRKRGIEPAESKIAPRRQIALKHPPVIQRRTGGHSLPPSVAASRAKVPLAPSHAKTPPPSDLATELAEARRLADAGQSAAAIAKCNDCLAAHGPSSHAYYLLGLVNDAAGNISHAGDFYRKAVYLESDHYEALAQLSLLSKKSGDAAAARQWSQRAQRAHEKLAAKTHGRSHSKT
jgi:chemotaxis protein methyltransferase WspC